LSRAPPDCQDRCPKHRLPVIIRRINHGAFLFRTAALLLAAVILASACGDSNRSTPTTPSPTPTPAPARFTLTGTVRATATGDGIGGANVSIIGGVNTGRTTTAEASGRYVLADLTAGQFTLRAVAPGYLPLEQPVTLSADHVQDVSLTLSQFTTNGWLVDALTSAGLGGVTIAGGGFSAAPSAADGFFTITGSTATGDPAMFTFSAPGIVERRTSLRVPGADAIVSVIPTSFDLRAFDEMCRGSQLLRWTAPPPLTIERRTLQFTSTGASTFTALSGSLTDAEVGQLEGDLTWALPPLTGSRFETFGDVVVQESAPGATVPFLVSGRITVARFDGLTAATGFWGFSRWQFRSTGEVIGATIMLDANFETSGSPFRRSLRAHELGHALGYNHVTVRPSVMNSNARTEPNAFDREATQIVYQRPPGNRPPDTDPDPFSINTMRLTQRWSVGIH
jgi:hypothetical protein